MISNKTVLRLESQKIHKQKFQGKYQEDSEKSQFASLLKSENTVLCISVDPRPHGLETRVNIRISTHPCSPRTFDCFSWDLAKKKIQNGQLKKTTFFKTINSQYFFTKLSGIGPWVSRINWCFLIKLQKNF
jgi:hypothetical protein